MNNELLFVLAMLLALTSISFIYLRFGAPALYAWVVLNTVMSAIFVTKTFALFGVSAVGGNITYGVVFFATDMLSEFHGKREAQRSVAIGFAALVTFTIGTTLLLNMTPVADDWAHPHLSALFGVIPRILAGTAIAYALSQYLDTVLYSALFTFRRLWVRNLGSTVTSQAVDTLVFCSVALLGTVPIGVWWEIVLTTYVFKLVVAALDTPFLYFVRSKVRLSEPHAVV
jgi:queuosine precursor transporter